VHRKEIKNSGGIQEAECRLVPLANPEALVIKPLNHENKIQPSPATAHLPGTAFPVSETYLTGSPDNNIVAAYRRPCFFQVLSSIRLAKQEPDENEL
jgi:hypothetical protein